MKIHFDNVSFNSRSGPNTFASRLAKGLFERGLEVDNYATDANLSLVFIEPSGAPLAKKTIQRLDGIWFKPDEFLHKNSRIKSLYDHTNCVIWQSEFDKTMTIRHWSTPQHGTVLRNGCDTSPADITDEALLSLRKQYEMVFVCSANWHPQKRLQSNIELFFHLKEQYNNSCLIVMGSNPQPFVASPHVYYTGNLTHDKCREVFAISDWMLHLAWLDHCPNTVVEALSQQTPVICSSAGGTCELVQGYGIIINERKRYDFELADYDNPPDIDVSQVQNLPQIHELKEHANINIDDVVSSYIELFNKICI